MPYHSSKNFHRAEQEALDKIEEIYWIDNKKFYDHDYDYWRYYDYYEHFQCHDCASYCPCKEYNWNKSFDTEWVKKIGMEGGIARCVCCFDFDCPYSRCRCELCYFYRRRSLRNIVDSCFSAQQILDMDAPSDPRVFIKKELHQIIRSQEPLEPMKINIKYIKCSTIDKCWNILREELLEYHKQKEMRETLEMLTKYGLTLEEHEKLKQKRRLHKELLRKITVGGGPTKKIDG